MWEKVKNQRTISFKDTNGPFMIHIIKSGFKNKYMVVHENAYEDQDFGKVDIHTKEEIKAIYKIELPIFLLEPGELYKTSDHILKYSHDEEEMSYFSFVEGDSEEFSMRDDGLIPFPTTFVHHFKKVNNEK